MALSLRTIRELPDARETVDAVREMMGLRPLYGVETPSEYRIEMPDPGYEEKDESLSALAYLKSLKKGART